MNQEFSIKTNDGIMLYARNWDAQGSLKGLICLVHGIGEHCNRYGHVAAALNASGLAVISMDHRGHGKSEGPRGHIPSYEALMSDIELLISEGKKRYANVPVFLYGHSLGGNLVINYALRRKPPLAGVIATGPALRTAFQPSAIKLLIGRTLYSIAPGLTMDSGLDPTGISRDKKVVQAYINDPLVHSKISARLAIDLLDSGLWALEHAAEFSLPLLLIHGSNDALTSVTASQEFAKKMKPGLCTLSIPEGLFHEVHNEPEKDQIFTEIIEWVNEKLS